MHTPPSEMARQSALRTTLPARPALLDGRDGMPTDDNPHNRIVLSPATDGDDLSSSTENVPNPMPCGLFPRGFYLGRVAERAVDLIARLALPLSMRLIQHRRRVGMALVLFGFGCALRPEFLDAGAKERDDHGPLVIVPDIVNFGRVNDTSGPLEVSFTISNRGTQPLEITGARSGCGCTVPRLSKSVVPPRGQLVVPVKVNILGRYGKFENRVFVDVSGQTEPRSALITGTILQDLWFDGPGIICSATESGPTRETSFEVRTVNWPSVAFERNGLEKGISLEELSRQRRADETVITFRLRIDQSRAASARVRYLMLQPTDKRIRPLTIPVICYEQTVRHDDAVGRLRSSPINLGVIGQGEERRLSLRGASHILTSPTTATAVHVLQGIEVDLNGLNEAQDSLEVAVRVGPSVPTGLLDGQCRLRSPAGKAYSAAVIGIVIPGKVTANFVNLADLLRPARISLGVIPRGEERRFQVFGSPQLLKSMKVACVHHIPNGAKVDLHRLNGAQNSLEVAIRFGPSVPTGLLDGRIRLFSPGGKEFFVDVFGIVVAGDSVETSAGTAPGKVTTSLSRK